MDLTKLKTVRAAHRGSVADLLRNYEEVQGNPSNVDFCHLSTILELSYEKRKLLQTFNEQIVELSDIGDIEDEFTKTTEYNVTLITKIKQLEGFLKFQRDQQPPPTQRTRGDSLPPELPRFDERDHNTNHSESRSNFNHFQNKLPKLTLPTFSGDILQWQSFWDSFESTVHMDSTLSDVEKFRYLKTLLRDDAAQSIAGFTLTNANYRQAVNLLTERFGQPHKITQAYIQALLDLPKVRNNVNNLRVCYDRLESYIRGLEALGQHQDTFGTILIPIIFGKLPDEIKQNLVRQHGNISWTLNELRKAILHEVSILEIVRKPSTFECTGTEILPTTATFFTGTKSHPKPTKKANNNNFKAKVCTFCEESHSSNDCTRAPDYESRMSVVRRKKLCFNCLKPHQVSECRSKYSCRNCHRKHHTSLCRTNSNPSAITTKELSTSESGTSVNVVNSDVESSIPILHSFTVQQPTGVLLKTAVATVWFEQNQATANILFDEGAQRSFITESLARKLQLVHTRTDTISLSTFGDTNRNVRHLKLVTIHLETENGENLPLEVLIVPEIAVPLSNRIRQPIRDLTYLKGLRLAHPMTEEDTFEISLLIGVDYYWDIVQDKVIRGDGPTAVDSKIGYLLSGPLSKESKNFSSTVLNILTSHEIEEFNLERFWELESLGISTQESDENTKCTLETYQDNSIVLRDGQYQAKLPWKDDHPPLPTNYNVTLRRTQNTIKRLGQETSLLKKYGEIISDQERRGFIEKVDTTVSPNHPIHYIPHHAVKKDSTTTPIRIVYDCSCRQSSAHPSLNDCLQTFPPNINCLTTILMRFRLNKFALATDIEKAFLHVGLDEQDRDVTRFLWLTNPDDPNSPLCTYRFKAVLFGATCSPFILNATLLKHMDENDAPVTQLLKRDLYVDNILSSLPTESEALNYFRESRQLMSKASFNLRSWTSNSVALRDLATSECVLDTDAPTKILGMRWNVQTDLLSYPSRNLSYVQKSIITKRDILQQTSRVYDPLGFLSPVSVRAKILMQLLWEQKFGWDEPLPTEIRSSWIDLADDLDKAASLEIPRHYFLDRTEHDGNISLHVFCDASLKAYGAAVYISDGIQTRLVIAKNRVAPLKKITLPQLELMAAVVGSRLADHVISAIETTDITFWSDSQITLHWLLSSKQHKKCFIANRVKEIHERTQSHTWRYCPTDSNPADLLTRGIKLTDFKDNSLWFNGPKWLCDSTQWPIWNPKEVTTLPTIEVTDPNEFEVKSSPEISTRNSTGIHKLIDVKNFSSYTRLLHVTANVQRFISNCRSAKSRRQPGPLTTTELQFAGKTWIVDCQNKSYQAEITSMQSDCPSRLQLVRQLRLFIDKDGAIRCGGRIHNAPVTEEAKFPYLLPTHHELTTLIVMTSLREFHRTSGNNNQVIQVGDVVQIHENHSPRVMWKLAVLEELNKGNDGLVRSAKSEQV